MNEDENPDLTAGNEINSSRQLLVSSRNRSQHSQRALEEPESPDMLQMSAKQKLFFIQKQVSFDFDYMVNADGTPKVAHAKRSADFRPNAPIQSGQQPKHSTTVTSGNKAQIKPRFSLPQPLRTPMMTQQSELVSDESLGISPIKISADKNAISVINGADFISRDDELRSEDGIGSDEIKSDRPSESSELPEISPAKKAIRKIKSIDSEVRRSFTQQFPRQTKFDHSKFAIKDLIVNMPDEVHDEICGEETMEMLRRMSLDQMKALDNQILREELPRLKRKIGTININDKVKAFWERNCKQGVMHTRDGLIKRYIFSPQFKIDRGFVPNRYGKLVDSGISVEKRQPCCRLRKAHIYDGDESSDSYVEADDKRPDGFDNARTSAKLRVLERQFERRLEIYQRGARNWRILRLKLQTFVYLRAGLQQEAPLYVSEYTNRDMASIIQSEVKNRQNKDACRSGRFVISPFSQFNIIWTFFHRINLVIWSFIFWFRVAFGVHKEANGGNLETLAKVDLVFDGLMMAELVIRFFIGIPYNEQFKKQKMRSGNSLQERQQSVDMEVGYVNDLRKIAVYLLRTTFLIDFLSLVPFFCHNLIQTKEYNSGLYYIYYLKVLRFVFRRSVKNDIETIIKTLIFQDQLNYMVFVYNNIGYLFLMFRYLVKLHQQTCIWIFIGLISAENQVFTKYLTTEALRPDGKEFRGGWIRRMPEYSQYHVLKPKEGEEETFDWLQIYIGAWSLITETISKVGYGMPVTELNAIEMGFLIYVMLTNFTDLTATFIQVQREKISNSLAEFIVKKNQEIEHYVARIEDKSGNLPENRVYFDQFFKYAKIEFFWSTMNSYNSEFYKGLPPRLKQSLHQATQQELIKKFRFFFGDCSAAFAGTAENSIADKVLVRKVLTHLHMKISDNLETVIHASKEVDSIHLIHKGNVNVIDSTGLFVICTLREGSYFGESQILNAIRSNFEFRTGVRRKLKHRQADPIDMNKHWFYTIDAENFVKICQQFPKFYKHQVARSSLRRAHWMSIQQELYESYLKEAGALDNFVPLKLYETPDSSGASDFNKHFPVQALREKFLFKSYFRNKTHNLMTEDFLMAFPDMISAQAHQRIMAKVSSQTMRRLHNPHIEFQIDHHRAKVADEAYMQLTAIEDQESQELQTITRMGQIILKHQCSKLEVRVSIAIDYIENVLVKEWKQLLEASFASINSIEENKLLQFYQHVVSDPTNVDYGNQLKELEVTTQMVRQLKTMRMMQLEMTNNHYQEHVTTFLSDDARSEDGGNSSGSEGADAFQKRKLDRYRKSVLLRKNYSKASSLFVTPSQKSPILGTETKFAKQRNSGIILGRLSDGSSQGNAQANKPRAKHHIRDTDVIVEAEAESQSEGYENSESSVSEDASSKRTDFKRVSTVHIKKSDNFNMLLPDPLGMVASQETEDNADVADEKIASQDGLAVPESNHALMGSAQTPGGSHAPQEPVSISGCESAESVSVLQDLASMKSQNAGQEDLVAKPIVAKRVVSSAVLGSSPQPPTPKEHSRVSKTSIYEAIETSSQEVKPMMSCHESEVKPAEESKDQQSRRSKQAFRVVTPREYLQQQTSPLRASLQERAKTSSQAAREPSKSSQRQQTEMNNRQALGSSLAAASIAKGSSFTPDIIESARISVPQAEVPMRGPRTAVDHAFASKNTTQAAMSLYMTKNASASKAQQQQAAAKRSKVIPTAVLPQGFSPTERVQPPADPNKKPKFIH